MREIRIPIIYDVREAFGNSFGKMRKEMNNLDISNTRVARGFSSMARAGQEFAVRTGNAFGNMRKQFGGFVKDMMAKSPILGEIGGFLTNPLTLMTAGLITAGAVFANFAGDVRQASMEIRQEQAQLRFAFDATGNELNELTAQSRSIASVFNRDFKEVTGAANALQKEYEDLGLTASDSFALVEKGLLATNGQMDIEQIREYASQMRSVGMSAKDTIGFIAGSQKQGVFNDKAIDAIKEANLSLREMTQTQRDALAGIGLDPDSILKGFDSGQLTTMDAIREISRAMAGASTAARQTAIADIFKGAGEDAGEKFLLSLGSMNMELDAMIDRSDPLVRRQLKQLKVQEQIAAQQAIMAPMVNDLSDTWEDMGNSIKLGALKFINELTDPVGVLSNELSDQRKVVRDLETNINPLLDEYDRLSTRTDLNVTEQNRLKEIIQQVTGVIPSAASAFDAFGNAIGISTDRGREFIKMQKAIQRSKNRDLVNEATDQLKDQIEDIRDLERDLNRSKEGVLGRQRGQIDANRRKAALEIPKLSDDLVSTVNDIKSGFGFEKDDLNEFKKLIQDQTGLTDKEFNRRIKPIFLNLAGADPDSLEGDGSGGSGGDKTGTAQGTLNNIVGNSQHARNVTVQIGSLNEGGITVNSKTVNEGAQEVEQEFIEMLIRAVRNSEAIL